MILLALAVPLLTAASWSQDDQPTPIQGTWLLAEAEEVGNKTSYARQRPPRKLVIDGTAYRDYAFAAESQYELTDRGEVSVDVTTSPNQITMKSTKFPGQDRLGIYERNGDVLRLCLAPPRSTDRPKEFKTVTGLKLVLLTFRGPPLQGTWMLTEADERTTRDLLFGQHPCKLVIDGIVYSQYVFRLESGYLLTDHGQVSVDVTTSPNQITMKSTKFPGQDRLGIYERNGDVLRLCLAPPRSTDRPKEFKTGQGLKYVLFQSTPLQGIWLLAEAESEGKITSYADHTRSMRLIIDGNTYSDYVLYSGSGWQMTDRGVVSIDATVLPNQFTQKSTKSPDQTRVGVYERKGDELRICMPPPKTPDRPKELKPAKGSGFVLWTFRKARDEKP